MASSISMSLVFFTTLLLFAEKVKAQDTAYSKDFRLQEGLYYCLRQKFPNIEPPSADVAEGSAHDPESGRNFHWDKVKQAWIDSKTGESVCPREPSAEHPKDFRLQEGLYYCLRKKF